MLWSWLLLDDDSDVLGGDWLLPGVLVSVVLFVEPRTENAMVSRSAVEGVGKKLYNSKNLAIRFETMRSLIRSTDFRYELSLSMLFSTSKLVQLVVSESVN